jgi:Tetratricopeptide repeat
MARPDQASGRITPATLNSRRNLANAYRADSRTREAEALLESVLANYERTLGHDHPYTKTARENLSSLKRAAKVHRPNPAARQR